ncbi:hypothetical protein C8R44DRAFT_726206 [Mycena epipterygia]|nr:hypothetical protein C8R44DRAFT_726206 [Mycena epipterygia]
MFVRSVPCKAAYGFVDDYAVSETGDCGSLLCNIPVVTALGNRQGIRMQVTANGAQELAANYHTPDSTIRQIVPPVSVSHPPSVSLTSILYCIAINGECCGVRLRSKIMSNRRRAILNPRASERLHGGRYEEASIATLSPHIPIQSYSILNWFLAVTFILVMTTDSSHHFNPPSVPGAKLRFSTTPIVDSRGLVPGENPLRLLLSPHRLDARILDGSSAGV